MERKINEVQLFFETLNEFNSFEQTKKIYEFTNNLNPYLLESFIKEYECYVNGLSSDPFEDDDLEAPTLTVPFNGAEIIFNLNKVSSIVLSTNCSFIDILETIIKVIDNPIQPEPEALDLSDTKAIDKILYLQKLGVIDFLRGQQPFNTSVNSLASVLTAITGEKTVTLQPMLNPMLSKKVDDKNNPFNSNKAVERVEKQLINIGFNLNETN